MHKFQCTAFTAILSFSLFGSKIQAQYPAQIKIMTYNINAETHTDGDYADIADVVKAIKPTIAGMQKVDSLTVTAKPVDVLKYLGQQTAMVPTFSMSYQKNGGSYGVGFIADSTPKTSRRLAIPKGSASEDRSALEIGVTMGGERVRVIVTHLGYDNATVRSTQIGLILPWIDAGGTATDPVVIMADFNAQSSENCMKLLTDAGFEFVKGKNGVILDSTQKINHILYRPATRWKISDAGNPTYTASNRNPLWADMELLNPVVTTVATVNRASLAAVHPQLSGSRLRYSLAADAAVSIRLYDAKGRLARLIVNNARQSAGMHAVTVADNNLPSGCYYCMLFVDGRHYAATTAVVR